MSFSDMSKNAGRMVGPQIYFRDFLDRYLEEGGDIRKINFWSTELVHSYRISALYGQTLRCIRRNNPNKGSEARFSWAGNERSSSNVHNFFVVRDIAVHKDGDGVMGRGQLMITLDKVRSYQQRMPYRRIYES